MNKNHNFGYTKVDAKQKTKLVQNVFSRVAVNYDNMNDFMSLGMHRLWKKRFVEIIDCNNNENILDVGSGSGDIAFEITKTKIPVNLYLLDLNKKMLKEGKKRSTNCLKNQVPNPEGGKMRKNKVITSIRCTRTTGKVRITKIN